MSSVRINITLRSEEDRQEALRLAQEIGLPLSTLIQQLLKEKQRQWQEQEPRSSSKKKPSFKKASH